jgi:ornithine carbamoyltransferase
MSVDLEGRSFLTLLDFTPGELGYLLDLATELKATKAAGKEKRRLDGKNLALIFEKTSTRTRCAFEVAAYDQGASATYLGPTGTQIGHKETMKDTARVLGRMFDGIEYRGFGQERIDEFHPTQVLADVMTMKEHSTRPLGEVAYCYMGDARFNMGNSLMIGGALFGMDFRVAAPRALWPSKRLVERCTEIAEETGARLTLTESVEEAVSGADFIHTDVWVSMGEPETVWAERIEFLRPYQVDRRVFDLTGNPDAKFMHCLPAFHNRDTTVGEEIFQKFGLDGLEVTEEIFESEHSVVFDQAENRLHTIKAILVATLAR